ncbi:MAG: SPOR domain-containing protein [Desulfobacteraceae bacterium]
MNAQKPKGRKKSLLLMTGLVIIAGVIAAIVWLIVFKAPTQAQPPVKVAVRGKIIQPPKPLPEVQPTIQSDPSDDQPESAFSPDSDDAGALASIDQEIQNDAQIQKPAPVENVLPVRQDEIVAEETTNSNSQPKKQSDPALNASSETPAASTSRIKENRNTGTAEQGTEDLTQPPSSPEKKAGTIAPEVLQRPHFTIQVGAFREKAYAQKTMNQLQAKGYDVYIYETADKRMRSWYFVRFGKFDNREEAIITMAEFTHIQKRSAIIAKYDDPD